MGSFGLPRRHVLGVGPLFATTSYGASVVYRYGVSTLVWFRLRYLLHVEGSLVKSLGLLGQRLHRRFLRLPYCTLALSTRGLLGLLRQGFLPPLRLRSSSPSRSGGFWTYFVGYECGIIVGCFICGRPVNLSLASKRSPWWVGGPGFGTSP